MDDDSQIRLTHQDPRWRQEFEQTRSGVLQSCEGRVTRVEHIGGTALPGCISRPIIDLIAGGDHWQPPRQGDSADGTHSPAPAELVDSADLIEGLNFRRLPTPDWAMGAIRLIKPRAGETTHQLFLMPIDCPAWKRAIGLRDALRDDGEMRIRFEESKVALWKRCEGDRRQYDEGKQLLMAHFMDQLGIASDE